MSAEYIARHLGGRRSGSTWMAPCPAHDDQVPSLSLNDAGDGKVLVYCHAGCEQAQVIAALRLQGVWDEHGIMPRRHRQNNYNKEQSFKGLNSEIDRTVAALRLWNMAVPGAGTPAEPYFRSRGLRIGVPPSIRFHAGLRHPTGSVWPGLVALVRRGTDGNPVAVHRTYLSCGGASKAPIAPQKMMLGPCRGGAVRLADAAEILLIGEGIETCLAAMQASQLPAWAALSTSGLSALGLPMEIRKVIVLADGDEPGEAAAQKAATRWKREGRKVRIARAPAGMDFNDVLLGRNGLDQEGAA